MASLPASWIPHRRDDGELVGWIDIESAAPHFVPVDRLGRPREPVSDRLQAAALLEEIGLSCLTSSFFHGDAVVRIRSIDDRSVVVTTALTDAAGDRGEEYRLSFPPGEELSDL